MALMTIHSAHYLTKNINVCVDSVHFVLKYSQDFYLAVIPCLLFRFVAPPVSISTENNIFTYGKNIHLGFHRRFVSQADPV